MAQRYIYLPDELNEKLKEEKNASGLIQRLLKEYYDVEKEASQFAHMTLEEKKKLLTILEQKRKLEQEAEKLQHG